MPEWVRLLFMFRAEEREPRALEPRFVIDGRKLCIVK